MARGTWQGSGTWQTSGPDLSGLAPVALAFLIAYAAMAVIAQVIVWLAVIAGVLVTAAAVALVLLWRHTRRREAAFAAQLAARREREALTARPCPELPPVVNIYVADTGTAGRVIRQAIPGRGEQS